MDLRISNYADSRAFPRFHTVLLTRLAWSKSNNIEDSQQQFSKRHLSLSRVKSTLLDILIEFFVSGNYEFFQIALLEICARNSQHNFL